MNTRELITYIKRVSPAWSRQDILEFINTTISTVYSVPTEAMRYRDQLTGKSPLLVTTAGQLKYELSASLIGADIQFIKEVYIPNETYTYYGTKIEDSIKYSIKNSNGNSNATVLFSEDPMGGSYAVECFRKPNILLSESNEIDLPLDLVFPSLYRGVVGMIEIAEHGESNSYERFDKEELPEIRAALNSGPSTNLFLTSGSGF